MGQDCWESEEDQAVSPPAALQGAPPLGLWTGQWFPLAVEVRQSAQGLARGGDGNLGWGRNSAGPGGLREKIVF